MADTKTSATQVGREATEKIRESVATNEFTKKAKDAAYTIVGLGVMGAQRATLASKHAAKQLRFDESSGPIDLDALRAKSVDAKEIARRQFSKADEVLGGAITRLEEAFAPLEERLPESARVTVTKVRDAGRGIHEQVRTKVAGDTTPAGGQGSTDDAAGDDE